MSLGDRINEAWNTNPDRWDAIIGLPLFVVLWGGLLSLPAFLHGSDLRLAGFAVLGVIVATCLGSLVWSYVTTRRAEQWVPPPTGPPMLRAVRPFDQERD